ncbi:unnamed protein product [Cuscuta europaea]|uniref:Uncharacterized protein n=1 Tax=Cuscuta europaea TaxID=41803 RepID=A0A9P0YRB6_CUSEU|nr:unnamed protein product [Cuscuta europaea]
MAAYVAFFSFPFSFLFLFSFSFLFLFSPFFSSSLFLFLTSLLRKPLSRLLPRNTVAPSLRQRLYTELTALHHLPSSISFIREMPVQIGRIQGLPSPPVTAPATVGKCGGHI